MKKLITPRERIRAMYDPETKQEDIQEIRQVLRQERLLTGMQQLLTHPAWTNKLSRYAILCMLLMMPLSIVAQIFRSALCSAVGVVLALAVLVLVCLFMIQIEKEQLPVAEAFIRENTALYRHYCIPEVRRSVAQFTGVQLSRKNAIALVQKIRDEFGMGPIAKHHLR